MTWLFTIIGLVSLVVICIQDFKDRRFYWWLPVVSAVTFAGLFVTEQGWQNWLKASTVNLIFLGVQIGVVLIWLRLRQKRTGQKISQMIGLGDLVFTLALVLAMTPFNFMLHYVLVLILGMTIGLVFRYTTRGTWRVPLAGIMAGCYGLFLIANQISNSYTWYQDHWWM